MSDPIYDNLVNCESEVHSVTDDMVAIMQNYLPSFNINMLMGDNTYTAMLLVLSRHARAMISPVQQEQFDAIIYSARDAIQNLSTQENKALQYALNKALEL